MVHVLYLQDDYLGDMKQKSTVCNRVTNYRSYLLRFVSLYGILLLFGYPVTMKNKIKYREFCEKDHYSLSKKVIEGNWQGKLKPLSSSWDDTRPQPMRPHSSEGRSGIRSSSRPFSAFEVKKILVLFPHGSWIAPTNGTRRTKSKHQILCDIRHARPIKARYQFQSFIIRFP